MTDAVADDSPILVGEMNPYGGDPRYALWPQPASSAGGRLHSILDLSLTQYTRLRRYNLCTGRWSNSKATAEAARLVLTYPREERIVLLGRKVAAAFDLADVAPFSVSGRFILLPHPPPAAAARGTRPARGSTLGSSCAASARTGQPGSTPENDAPAPGRGRDRRT